MIATRKYCFKVTLQHLDSKLVREKWVKNRVQIGQLVADVDEKVFTVIDVIMLADACLPLTNLEVIP